MTAQTTSGDYALTNPTYPELQWSYAQHGDIACGEGVNENDLEKLANYWLIDDTDDNWSDKRRHQPRWIHRPDGLGNNGTKLANVIKPDSICMAPMLFIGWIPSAVFTAIAFGIAHIIKKIKSKLKTTD